MAQQDKLIVSVIALVSFIASIIAAVRGNFVYPVELFILSMVGILLVITLVLPDDDAASMFLHVAYFLAVTANIAYLYSVAGYLSAARLGALGIAILGLFISGMNLLMQPVPQTLTSEAKKLIAAEQKLSQARERLRAINEMIPAGKAESALRRKAKQRRRKR
ncbi:hypothetical protein HYY73_04200 [Candidatus Woesearchaeota archaeon]|nr:hypothetical protein [Candidatus Woesearchaeota archaeon]